MTVIFSTLFALLAFAANSILCRIALGTDLIDPAGFTIIRLLSGSITLYFILMLSQKFMRSNGVTNNETEITSKGSWLGSLCLFIYALTFSYAYIHLETGTGALLLFGTVQIFMVIYSLFLRVTLSKIEWLGLISAFSGFIYLVYPEVNTPSVSGLILMTISGLAWAGYTVIGKQSKAPLVDTCYNFFRTIPLVLGLTLLTFSTAEYSSNGIWLAVTSGALMSGVGYAIWYVALKGLTATQAGVLQLSVPIIAALGGVFFMNEMLTLRLSISMIIVVGGIALVLLGKKITSLLPSKTLNE